MKTRTPTEHEVKCWPKFYDALLDGTKKFEARRNDRDYRVGDILVEREWIPHAGWWSALGKYTDRVARYRITYILNGSADNRTTGIGEGYCVMSVERILN